MRISDWSSDVCSSDLTNDRLPVLERRLRVDEMLAADDGAAPDDIFGGLALGTLSGQQDRARRQSAGTGVGRRRRRIGEMKVHQIGRASCRERVCQYV